MYVFPPKRLQEIKIFIVKTTNKKTPKRELKSNTHARHNSKPFIDTRGVGDSFLTTGNKRSQALIYYVLKDMKYKILVKVCLVFKNVFALSSLKWPHF